MKLTPCPVRANFFEKYRDIITWNTLDGWKTTIDSGGTLLARGLFLTMTTPTTINTDIKLCAHGATLGVPRLGKKLNFEIWIEHLTHITDVDIWLRLASDTSDPPLETARHIGWKISGGRLWASNADGSLQRLSDTGFTLTTGAINARLRLEYLPLQYARFYVNDILRVTHTDRLNPDESSMLDLQIRTLIAATRSIRLRRIYIEQDH